MSYDLGHMTQH